MTDTPTTDTSAERIELPGGMYAKHYGGHEPDLFDVFLPDGRVLADAVSGDRVRAMAALAPKAAAEGAERSTADIATALGLFASCIKSGENWSATCEEVRKKAWTQLEALSRPAAPAPEAAANDVELVDAIEQGGSNLEFYKLDGPDSDDLKDAKARLASARTALFDRLAQKDAEIKKRDVVLSKYRTALASAGSVPDELRRLSEVAVAGPLSVSGVRSSCDEPSCTWIDSPSIPGLLAIPTANGKKALSALADARFIASCVNFVRDLIARTPPAAQPDQPGMGVR